MALINKIKTYDGKIAIKRTLGEPSFAEKWKAYNTGETKNWLKYSDLEDLVAYAYDKNISTTVGELEVLFYEKGIKDKASALEYIRDHVSEFTPLVNDKYRYVNSGSKGAYGDGFSYQSHLHTWHDCECDCCKKDDD